MGQRSQRARTFGWASIFLAIGSCDIGLNLAMLFLRDDLGAGDLLNIALFVVLGGGSILAAGHIAAGGGPLRRRVALATLSLALLWLALAGIMAAALVLGELRDPLYRHLFGPGAASEAGLTAGLAASVPFSLVAAAAGWREYLRAGGRSRPGGR